MCHTVTHLLQLLVESKQWAEELKLASLACPWTMAPSSADLRIIGFDLQHRPVIYSSMLMVSTPHASPLASSHNRVTFPLSPLAPPQRNTSMRTPDQTQLNTSCIMAKAAACTSDNCPSNCTWVNNFNGFSMSDLNPMFAIKAAKAKFLDIYGLLTALPFQFHCRNLPSILQQTSIRINNNTDSNKTLRNWPLAGLQRAFPRAPAPQDHRRPPFYLLGLAQSCKTVHCAGDVFLRSPF